MSPTDQFHRLRSRRGAKKAILAVAASMLTAAYSRRQPKTLFDVLHLRARSAIKILIYNDS
jgi:hypothetical protein